MTRLPFCPVALAAMRAPAPAHACAPLPPFASGTGGSRLDAASRPWAGTWTGEIRRARHPSHAECPLST